MLAPRHRKGRSAEHEAPRPTNQGTIHVFTGARGTRIKRSVEKMQCLGPLLDYSITFIEKDAALVPTSAAYEALVIATDIGRFEVRGVLVDNGSSADVLYYEAFKKMGFDEAKLILMDALLVGFNGGSVYLWGAVALSFQLAVDCMTTLLIVDVSSAYNAIMGRPTLNVLWAIPSTYHQMVKFPTVKGTSTVHGSHQLAKRCHLAALKQARVGEMLQIESNSRNEAERPTPAGALEEISLAPGRQVKIGADLSPACKESLVALLREFSNLSAWTPADMLGIDPNIISHYLVVNPLARPII